ncbi:hypothetical protein [Glutamicibacter sp. 2E12]|uniref:hypothetical protein n=1 Tax=Glutamicibacter sp. 2E12 TaxID=3416181 RepID=UPI003CE93851
MRSLLPAGKRWEDAKELLAVRSNDAHALYSVSLAQQLLGHHPQADANIVLPAMLLHDIGWSAVDPALVLGAIAPGAGNAELGQVQITDWEKVYAAIPHQDIFTERKIDRPGALVVVRPDMYVAQVLPLTARAELAEFFSKNMALPKVPEFS